jgi:hypothetical protein
VESTEVRLFGELEVLDGGVPVPVRGAKQRPCWRCRAFMRRSRSATMSSSSAGDSGGRLATARSLRSLRLRRRHWSLVALTTARRAYGSGSSSRPQRRYTPVSASCAASSAAPRSPHSANDSRTRESPLTCTNSSNAAKRSCLTVTSGRVDLSSASTSPSPRRLSAQADLAARPPQKGPATDVTGRTHLAPAISGVPAGLGEALIGLGPASIIAAARSALHAGGHRDAMVNLPPVIPPHLRRKNER